MRDAFFDLLLGGRCAGCGRPGRVLCPHCRDQLPDGGHPVRPDPAPAGLPAVLAAGEYADPLRRLVLAHKERQAFGLTGPLGRVLASVLVSTVASLDEGAGSAAVRPDPALVLVPVPSSPGATRRRGHDPVLRMVRVAARTLTRTPAVRGRAVAVAPLLRVAQPVADQAGLDAAARAANLDGRLAVRPRAHRVLADRAARTRTPVLLVLCDDVLTTGATLTEAQRALRAVGVPAAAAATLAATRKRLGASPGTGSGGP